MTGTTGAGLLVQRTLAPGIIALTLVILLAVRCNVKVEAAVLPMSDTWDIAITIPELGDFTAKRTWYRYEAELYGASLSTQFTADERTEAARVHPREIRQVVKYSRSAEVAERDLDLLMMRRLFDVIFLMQARTPAEDVPIRPGRHEKHVKRWSSDREVAYEIAYLLNNISIDTILVGDANILTEDRALKIAEISYEKHQDLLGLRLSRPDREAGGATGFATFMNYLFRILVPVIGFSALLLLYPARERGRTMLTRPDALSLVLATLYAVLLWSSIYVSGVGGRLYFIIEGWDGALIVGLTALVAGMGLHLVWEQRFVLRDPPALAPVPWGSRLSTAQTSCPRCKQLSPASSASCTACGLEFRGRA